MSSEMYSEDSVVASEQERDVLQRLEQMLADRPDRRIGIHDDDDGFIEVPESVQAVVREAIRILANDEAVSVSAIDRELTTQQAADLLNMSRTYFTQLLDHGDIAFHRVGTHRRVRLQDLLTYKRERDAQRREGLRRLTRKSRRLGLYDLPVDPTS